LLGSLGAQQETSAAEIEAGIMQDIPIARLGEPEEIGKLTAFLASRAAANMTGTSMTADGGWARAIT
jgi:3-oxoacyl-[acyl-carrier protein] reductase